MTQPLSEIYTRANQQVQNLLKPGWDGNKFEPERYWENFCDWLEDHPVAMGDALKALGIPADQVEEDFEVLRGLDPDASYSKMPPWLTADYEEDLASYLEGRGAHLAPTSAHLTAQRQTLLPRTTWLVHFTYQAEAVATQGFRKGFADHRRLGLTMHFPEEAPEKAGTGYNFAFLAQGQGQGQGQEALQAALTDHYGDGAVMFQNSGVQAYHKGDEEVQIMFKGDQVDPSHLVHLKQWNDRSWSVMSKITRQALVTGHFEQCTAWVVQHYQQYRNQFAVSPGTYNKQTMQLNEAKESSAPAIGKGSGVSWKYGTGRASGKVTSVHPGSVTRTLKGSEITRNGTAENPALVITQPNGDRVLKLRSEVSLSKAALNEQFLLDHQALLQEAVAHYCSEHQDDILSGTLTKTQLNEGILTGIQAMFGKGSAVRQAAGDLTHAAAGKFQAAKQAVGQGVERLRNDYVAGDASSELRRLAQQRNAAESGFEVKMAHFKTNVRAIQQERWDLKKEHRGLMKQFHQSAHAQYVRAAQALQIPVAKGDAFYDAVDAALETRNLVPVVLHESWGQLDEETLEEGRWGYKPTPEEAENQFQINNRRRVLPGSNEVAQKMADAGQPLPNGRTGVRVVDNHQTQNGERASALSALNHAGSQRRTSQAPYNQGTQGQKNLKASSQEWLAHAQKLNANPAVVAPLREDDCAASGGMETPLALAEEQAFAAQPGDPTNRAVAGARAQQRAAAPATPRAQVASDLQHAGQIRQFVQNPLTGTPPTDTQPQKDAAKAYVARARQTAAPMPAGLAEAPLVPTF